MIHDLHAFCCQLAPSVWFWELWHSGLCEWNSNNVIVDVTDTPDDAGTVWESGPRHTVQHGVIWSARKHDRNSFVKAGHCLPVTVNFKEPPQWLSHSFKGKLPDTETAFKASLRAHMTTFLCCNWRAAFRAWWGWRTIVAGSVWLGASGPCSAGLSSQQ